MKRSMFVLAIVAASFTPGCRDTDSISNPLSSQRTLTTKRMDIQPVDFVVPLRGILAVPGKDDTLPVEVDGQITIRMSEMPAEPMACVWTRFALVLHANGSLRPLGMSAPVWELTGRSSDEILLEVQGRLDKAYVLQRRSDGMTLHVRLLITREDITLEAMSLRLPKVVYQKETN